MKVKCIASEIEPEFIVGEIYKVRSNKIHGNGSRVYGPWLLSEGLKIMTRNNQVIASFEVVKGKKVQ